MLIFSRVAARIAWICAILLVIGLAVGGVLTFVTSVSHTLTTIQPSDKPTAAVEEQETCPAEFVQVAGDNANNRVDNQFATKYEQMLVAVTSNGTALDDGQRKLLLENSANNAQRLAIWASAFGLYENPNDWSRLVNGDCLSSEGQVLYFQFEGALKASGFTQGIAPSDGYNSGVGPDGTYGVGDPDVNGDLTAIQIILPDGTVIWIMVRCGNPVFPPGPPPLHPKVPTDDVGANPAVPPFYQDGQDPTQHHSISWDPSAANGYQGSYQDVLNKEAAAKAAAEEANQENTEKHEEAVAESTDVEPAATPLPSAPPPVW